MPAANPGNSCRGGPGGESSGFLPGVPLPALGMDEDPLGLGLADAVSGALAAAEQDWLLPPAAVLTTAGAWLVVALLS